MASNIKNTSDLRAMLLDVIDDVRHQRIEAGDAKAISSLASQVLTSAKLDIDVMKANLGGKDDSKKITATLLTYDDNKLRSPYTGLTDDDFQNIITMKNENKTLAVICDKLKDRDKKLISAVYYGKAYGGEDAK